MAQKGAKLLSKSVSRRSSRIALAELINEHRLVLCPLLGATNDHESCIASRGSFLQRDRLLGDSFGPMRAKAGHKQLNRPQRTCISLSHNLLIQLSGLMTSLIPSSGKIRQILISYMLSTVPGLLGGRLFVFQHSIDGSGRHSDHLRDIFSFVPSPKQLPNLLMPTNALGMALPPFLLDSPYRGCFGRRKRS